MADGGWLRKTRSAPPLPSTLNCGFPLIEVVIGLTILTMITGTLFYTNGDVVPAVIGYVFAAVMLVGLYFTGE